MLLGTSLFVVNVASNYKATQPAGRDISRTHVCTRPPCRAHHPHNYGCVQFRRFFRAELVRPRLLNMESYQPPLHFLQN